MSMALESHRRQNRDRHDAREDLTLFAGCIVISVLLFFCTLAYAQLFSNYQANPSIEGIDAVPYNSQFDVPRTAEKISRKENV